jgi:hypothetical protein
MWKYFTENNTKVWVDVLPAFMKSYNTSTHMLEESRVNIPDNSRDPFHQDVVNASDDLINMAERLKNEGKITEQERREFAGITAPKGPRRKG